MSVLLLNHPSDIQSRRAKIDSPLKNLKKQTIKIATNQVRNRRTQEDQSF